MSWYLARLKPRQESTACVNLDAQGYRHYLPVAYCDRRVNGRMGKEPLFPGYGFIWLIEGIHDFAPLRHTKGMTGLVRLGGRPARVDNSLIDELRSRENADGVHTIYKLHYLPGDEVRIKSGPFKFYTAVVTAASGAERVRLLFENASRNMTVEVATEILEPVQA